MSDSIVCPDCGRTSPPGSLACVHCNFPLVPMEAKSPPARSAPEPPAASASAPPAEGPAPPPPAAPDPILPPFRPRGRPRRAGPTQSVSLWLFFGLIMAAVVFFVAIKGFKENSNPPVEGAKEDQQKHAEEYRAALAKDSTDAAAQVGLANVLYDTGNWSEAIVHYRAALARDSSLTHVLVDLGVCYFNLGDSDQAEHLFRLGLQRDPHQPVALFNLGIVSEHREDFEAALQYYHRAMQSDPPEGMREPLAQAMQRLMKKLGRTAPPLPDLGGSGK